MLLWIIYFSKSLNFKMRSNTYFRRNSFYRFMRKHLPSIKFLLKLSIIMFIHILQAFFNILAPRWININLFLRKMLILFLIFRLLRISKIIIIMLLNLCILFNIVLCLCLIWIIRKNFKVNVVLLIFIV